MTDHLQSVIAAVQQLQHALKSAGLRDGAVEVRLSHQDEANALRSAIRASPAYRDMIPVTEQARGPGDFIIKICDVKFVEPQR